MPPDRGSWVRREAGRWTYRVLAWTAAVRAADRLFPGVRLTGSPAARSLAAAVVAVVPATGDAAFAQLSPVLVRRAQRLARQGRWAGLAVTVAGFSTGAVASTRLALRPGAALARACGLVVQLPEGRDGTAAAWAARALAAAASRPLHWAREPDAVRAAVAGTADAAAAVGGLWLAEALLPGMRLEPAPGAYPALLVRAALALQLGSAEVDRRAPVQTAVDHLSLNAAGLFAASRSSRRMAVTLRVGGFWTFVPATVILAGTRVAVAVAHRALLAPQRSA